MLIYSILHSLQVHLNSHKQPQKFNDNTIRSRFIMLINSIIIFLVSVFQFTQKLNYYNNMIEILIMLIYFICSYRLRQVHSPFAHIMW